MIKKPVILLLLIIFCSDIYADEKHASGPKKVLIIFPYQPDLPYTMLAVQTINDEFANARDIKAVLYYEFMDLNRFPEKSYMDQMTNLLVTKYSKKNIDLVILANRSMLEFWMKNRNRISSAPALFFDVAPETIAEIKLPPDFTGTVSEMDYARAIMWYLKARPSTKEVILIRGTGNSDGEFIKPVMQLKESLGTSIKVTDWAELPLAEMKRRAASLPGNTVILCHLVMEDTAGFKFRPVDAIREIASVSSVPVISGYDQFIGTGTIGGYTYSIEMQAHEMTRMGLKILTGTPAKYIPVSSDRGNHFIFDHAALKHFGISISELPEGSIIKNRKFSPWERYRVEIIATFSGLVLLSVLSLYLIKLNRSLSRTRSVLKVMNIELETQVEERTRSLSDANRMLEDEISEKKRIETEQIKLIAAYQKALSEIKTLGGLIPICSSCKKIRNDEGYWQDVAVYISSHTDADFTHGLCPDCAKKLYPQYFKRKDS